MQSGLHICFIHGLVLPSEKFPCKTKHSIIMKAYLAHGLDQELFHAFSFIVSYSPFVCCHFFPFICWLQFLTLLLLVAISYSPFVGGHSILSIHWLPFLIAYFSFIGCHFLLSIWWLSYLTLHLLVVISYFPFVGCHFLLSICWFPFYVCYRDFISLVHTLIGPLCHNVIQSHCSSSGSFINLHIYMDQRMVFSL